MRIIDRFKPFRLVPNPLCKVVAKIDFFVFSIFAYSIFVKVLSVSRARIVYFISFCKLCKSKLHLHYNARLDGQVNCHNLALKQHIISLKNTQNHENQDSKIDAAAVISSSGARTNQGTDIAGLAFMTAKRRIL